MRPELAERPWFFETAQRKKIRRCLSTWARSLNPVSFWKRVKLETEPNVKRLIIYALIVVFMPILFHYGWHTRCERLREQRTYYSAGRTARELDCADSDHCEARASDES
jgi:hypothetical protein